MLGDLAHGLVRALLGSVVEALSAWRHDRALTELGYTAADRAAARAGVADAEAAAVVSARLRADPEYARRVRDAFTRR